MRMEYLLQPEDVREALRWRSTAQRRKLRLALSLGLTFAGAVVAALLVPKGAPPAAQPSSQNLASPPSRLWDDSSLALMAWGMSFALFGFIWFRHTETLYRWNGFVGCTETPTLMLLFLSGDRRLMIPRRAAPSEADWQQLRPPEAG